jgi:protein subunit release factor A
MRKEKITRIRGRDQIRINPKRSEDAKNVMVEIRAGTGGEQVSFAEIYSECILNIVKAADGEHL